MCLWFYNFLCFFVVVFTDTTCGIILISRLVFVCLRFVFMCVVFLCVCVSVFAIKYQTVQRGR